MAVILSDEQAEAWLTAPPEEALSLLKPHPSEAMHAYPVSTAVNDPKNNRPDVADAVGSPTTAGPAEER
jgi:putative SOS response-associated peptidase YedK